MNMNHKKKLVAALMTAGFLMTLPLSVNASPALDAGAKQVADTSAEVLSVIGTVKDAVTAKAAEAKLSAAMTKFRAADAAFNASLAKEQPKNQQEGDAMDKAVAQYQKANQTLADMQLKVLGNKEVGEVLGKAFHSPGSKEASSKASAQ